jgi:glutathione synthase/RimK-type ligase-like ATP-grasp enzyme
LVNRPLTGILVNYKSSRKPILERYRHYHDHNQSLFSFTPAHIFWKKRRIIGLYFKGGRWIEGRFPFPNVVYNQSYNKNPATIQRLRNIIGQTKCFNTINCFSKWDIYTLLSQSSFKPYVPDTFIYHAENVLELLERYNLLFIKPFYGNRGRGIYRVELMEQGDIHISSHTLAPHYIYRKKEEAQQKLLELLHTKNMIVQEGVQLSQIDNQNYDIRVLIQKDIRGEWSVSSIVCRVADEHYFNTSIYKGIYEAKDVFPRIFTSEKEALIVQSLNELSIGVALSLEAHLGTLGELSVDFVLDKDWNLWIIELNGKPQKSIYKDIKNFQHQQLIYSKPLKYANYLAQSRHK